MRRWGMMMVAASLGSAVLGGAAHGDMAVGPGAGPGSPLRFGGMRFLAPKLARSEAGLTLAVSPSVAVQLHYERTAMAPMMRRDHDDGILTRLRWTF